MPTGSFDPELLRNGRFFFSYLILHLVISCLQLAALWASHAQTADWAAQNQAANAHSRLPRVLLVADAAGRVCLS